MSTASTLEELHRFFEDDPDDYQLESEADSRLKALYACLVNTTSRTMLQIGLSGLLTYVKASQRSAIIDELLLSKDYISEIITIAADHFTTAPLLSATCLYECMLSYPKKFSTFLINKFRPALPRVIYKKMSGPSEICCKCIAHLSVLGIPSSSKQAKSWKNEFDRYLKIASLLIDQVYSGINDPLCPEVTDLETALIAEIGDVISSADYAAIFCNCCHILRYLFYVQLESPVPVPCERAFKLISKVLSINSQQFTILHRKQHLPTLLACCVQFCVTLVTFNPSSFMFNIRSIFSLIISILDLVRPQAEYLTLSASIYQLLTNLLALFQRQVRMDVDMLQKLIRWILNDTTIRARTRIPVAYLSKPDHNLSRAAISCAQQLLNVYSDHMPKDQYTLLQNHFIHTLMACQAANSVINKPYDDETCRVGLYDILESLLINERGDCTTIIGISKDVIDNAASLDSSVKVKMAVRKLKLIWQQVHDSSSQLYQPWSFLNVDQPRKVPTTTIQAPMSSHDLRNVFATPSMPMISNVQASPAMTMMNTEASSSMHAHTLAKPAVYQQAMETTPPAFPQTSSLPIVPPPPPVMQFDAPLADSSKQDYSAGTDRQTKRFKLAEPPAVEIDLDEDDDGAEQIFADESDDEERENEQMDEYDEHIGEESEEMDESDEVDDDENLDDEGDSDIDSEEDDENFLRTNGVKKANQHLGVHQSNIDMRGMDGAASDPYLQTMNDNLHKKFRRQNHFEQPYPTPSGFPHMLNNNADMYPAAPLNGDYKNNQNQPALGNGQAATAGASNDADDDDDIVLVSDDDSGEKKSASKSDDVPPYMTDLPITYTNSVVTKSTAAMVMNDGLLGKDLLNDIDRSARENVLRGETASVDNSTTSLNLAVQETMESLRDAVNLVSDDYPISAGGQV